MAFQIGHMRSTISARVNLSTSRNMRQSLDKKKGLVGPIPSLAKKAPSIKNEIDRKSRCKYLLLNLTNIGRGSGQVKMRQCGIILESFQSLLRKRHHLDCSISYANQAY